MTELASAVGSIGFAWLGEPEHLGVAPAIGVASAVGVGLGLLILLLGAGTAIARREHQRLAELANARNAEADVPPPRTH